uniref:Ribosomal protein S1 n=1 Tax=Acrochaetium secundatum TaxID=209631 RepID=A0A4D6BLJ7_9FLOR|nr:ribosomal protein S1 [Acrochaetium secundatum]QBX88367.1 ribosomal protein S1 [Acrochaetium secundatum]
MCFTHKNFARVLNQYQYKFNTGDIIAGTVFSEEKNGYLIDIGDNNAAYLPNEEISVVVNNSNDISRYKTHEFFILASNPDSKQLILSLRRLRYIRSWDRIKQIKQEDIVLGVEVKSLNKGGIIVEVESIRGFVPNSHLAYMIDKEKLIGTRLKCKLLIANEHFNQLVLSNRCAVLERMLDSLQIGLAISAPITEIKPYGVFFNVNNIPALLHISEIPTRYLNNIRNNFPLNQKKIIKIIHIDIKQGRLSVTLQKNLS